MSVKHNSSIVLLSAPEMAQFVNECGQEGEDIEIQPNPGEDIQPEGQHVVESDHMALEFNHNEVLYALKALSLNSVSLGDYIVVINGVVDVTICGEPYLALQLWLNMTSGKCSTVALLITVSISVLQFARNC